MRSILLLLIAAIALPASEPKFTAEQIAFYEKDVKPLLKENCFKCHGDDPEKIRGDLNLKSRASILKGGDSGPAVSLDKPAESLLLLAITGKRTDNGESMPPAGQLPDNQIAILKKWVNDKLPVNAADLGVAEAKAGRVVITEESRKYWAYQPVRKAAIPATENAIDLFLTMKLREKNLTANGPAERIALVRRVYFDLIGLPPTPEQVDAFVNDMSPNAFEKLLDQLLASPHYGEKWGRHWLDVVRYAESNGYERDGPKPLAWRYRDYVIRSFNADKPYDQFLREQLAGDEMPGGNPDQIIATGFYRLGLWDDEPSDLQQSIIDGYDDFVTTVGQGMLGLSLNCARCHDHKRDPILQADYYKFVAFFRDIRPYSETRDVRSPNNMADISPPEKRQHYEKELAERKDRLGKLKVEMKPIEDAAIKKMPPRDQLAVDDGQRDQIVKKVPQFLEGEEKTEYEKLRKRLSELQRKPLPSQDLALALANCRTHCPPVHVLARGNPHAPKEKELCPPGFPTVLGQSDPAIEAKPKSSGRRTALANWITAKDNPFTARVMVNRLWQHHFGKGLVPTPNDFGKLGELPTHPELLDWLAADFVENGWKIKRMHKLIMLSAAYQRSSQGHEKNLLADPTNANYWRFPMRRLGAEEVRDSMLMVAGKLNLTQFGESVYPKIPDEVLQGQSRPGEHWLKGKGGGFDPKNPDAGNRRTIYVSVKRALQVPILALHDQADTDSSCPVRYTTTVPTQALGLLNGEFSHAMANALAARLMKNTGDSDEKKITLAIRLTTGRTPGAEEIERDVLFVKRLQTEHKLDAAAALQRYCLMLLNANEFIYLD